MRWTLDPDAGWVLIDRSSPPALDPAGLLARVAGEAGAIAELRAQVPGTGRIYLLFEGGKLPDEAALATHAERVFRNDAFEFWLLKE